MRLTHKIIIAAVIVVGIVGGAGAYYGDSEPEMLIGKITRSDLRQAPYLKWYQRYEGEYTPAEHADLGSLLKDVDITIILGTWCHDSQREVPHFYKILSSVGANLKNVTLLAVDKDFKAEGLEVKSYGITNTPTFIFYRRGQEINRIVETPVISLEQDMHAILTGEDYRHSKLE